MKRLSLILVAIIACFSAFGSLSFDVESESGVFSFDFVSSEQLFEESPFDPYSFVTQGGVFFFPNKTDSVLNVRVLGKDSSGNYKYVDLPLESEESDYATNGMNYIYLKTAGQASLFNLEFDYENIPLIEFNVAFKGYLDTMFYAGGDNTCCGFDGSYLIAGELRFDKKYSLRVGMHHLSGHYGDEILKELYENNDGYWSKNNFTVYSATQYVRDNELMVGFSAKLNDFTPYVLASAPTLESWVRPFIHNTAYNKISTDRLAWGDGWPDDDEKEYSDDRAACCDAQDAARDSFYLALRLSVGFDWEKDFGFCKIYAGGNIQAYQDGQTEHEIGGYDSSNPWDVDFTVGAGVEFSEIYGHSVSLEVYDHYGRLPILNFYYERANYIFVGATIK